MPSKSQIYPLLEPSRTLTINLKEVVMRRLFIYAGVAGYSTGGAFAARNHVSQGGEETTAALSGKRIEARPGNLAERMSCWKW